MKKYISLALIMAFAVLTCAACAGKTDNGGGVPNESAPSVNLPVDDNDTNDFAPSDVPQILAEPSAAAGNAPSNTPEVVPSGTNRTADEMREQPSSAPLASAEPSAASQPSPSTVPNPNANETQQSAEINNNPTEINKEQTKMLVAYFSCTGNTKRLAEYAADALGADIYEIKPNEPYSAADLDYNDPKSRTSIEQNDKTARPEIANSATNIDGYGAIFIGYPIWWGEAPKIISTFLESYDFAGKTIVPFCTSGSSGIGSSDMNLHAFETSANWMPGKRFSGGASKTDVSEWISGLNLKTVETSQAETAETKNLIITVGDTDFTAAFADNSSAEALRELLTESPLTIQMSDYGGFEKVGSLPENLPTNNEQISTAAGDLILYQGNQFVIYHSTNSWNFTRLGKIDNVTGDELKEALGTGDVTITLSID
jgi:flavodoxin